MLLGKSALGRAFEPFVQAWLEVEPLIYERVDSLSSGAPQGTVEDFQHLCVVIDAVLVDLMQGRLPSRTSVPNACVFARLWLEADWLAGRLSFLTATYAEAFASSSEADAAPSTQMSPRRGD